MADKQATKEIPAADKPATDEAADNELRAILEGSRPSPPSRSSTAEDRFRGWLLHLVRDAYGRSGFGADAGPATPGPGLAAPGPLPA